MKSVYKVQFGRLNYKRFYFYNGLISLPFGHPILEPLRKEKRKHCLIHKKLKKRNLNS